MAKTSNRLQAKRGSAKAVESTSKRPRGCSGKEAAEGRRSRPRTARTTPTTKAPGHVELRLPALDSQPCLTPTPRKRLTQALPSGRSPTKAKRKVSAPAALKTAHEEDLEAVVIALSALNGYEEAVRAFIAGPGPAGYAASTFASARQGLRAARAQREEELRQWHCEVELATAREKQKRIATEKAELEELFETQLRGLLAGACAHEAAFQRALARLQVAATAAGVAESLLLTLPTVLRRTPQERSSLDTTAVELLLERLETYAQAVDDRVAASDARVRAAEVACAGTAVAEDLSTLLCRQALAEAALAKAESVLAALQRLSGQQADSAP